MISEKNILILESIRAIIKMIRGEKTRYSIVVIPNPQDNSINISILNLTDNQAIFRYKMNCNELEYLEIINTLRNDFISEDIFISKLTYTKKENEIRYYQQDIFLNNLQMCILLNTKKEEIEAIKTNNLIVKQNLDEEKSNIKTIQHQFIG